MKEGYVKFTGVYSELKNMGFTFQKLYASNYMQWERNHFRVWKKGGDITHDRYDLFKIARFLKTNPLVRTQRDIETGKKTIMVFFKFYVDQEADPYDYDYYPMTEENRQKYQENNALWGGDDFDENNPPPYLGSIESCTNVFVEQLQELNDLGYYTLTEYTDKELEEMK